MALSHTQMATLADLAKKAWTKQPPEEKAEAQKQAAEAFNDPLVSATKIYDHWRRSRQMKSVGKSSMSEMSNRHYLRLKSLWEELAGDINPALRTMAHEFDEKKRQAMHLLETETKAGDLAWPGYPRAIARTQCCGRGLDELNADELMHLVFTIRNRARAKSKNREAASAKPGTSFQNREAPPIVEPDEAPAPPAGYDLDEPNPW